MTDLEREQILVCIRTMHEICGYGKSESDTEAFLDMLEEAVVKTVFEREESHEDGLCLDCQRALAWNLSSIAEEEINAKAEMN